jgi:hypothetical protein
VDQALDALLCEWSLVHELPRMRCLTLAALKAFNSSSNSEILKASTRPYMGVHYHLPRSLEDRGRSEPLPVLDIEGAVHLRDFAEALHYKRWLVFAHGSTICCMRRKSRLRR